MLAIGARLMKGQGFWKSEYGDSIKVWGGLEGGVCWSGLDESYNRRGKEDCYSGLSLDSAWSE